MKRMLTACATPARTAVPRVARPERVRLVQAASADALAASPGQPLDAATRARLEPRFGHDFAGVRVHHDARAAANAAARGATAVTVGEHIRFAAGRYRPGTADGERLLAHELAHVVQQAAAVRAGVHAAAPPVPARARAEREAADAAARVVHGASAPALTPTGIAAACDPARQPAGTSGRLPTDSHWSYVVYANEVKLRYYLGLPPAQAAARAKKNLPGHVQVGTIPWVTNNPGNITQAPGADTGTLRGYPSSREMGSLGAYGGRYSIFGSERAGADAIGRYLRKLAAFGNNKDLTLAQAIRQYKGEERSEKEQRLAREKENAQRAKSGEPPLPALDVRETYLSDVTRRSKQRIVAVEALEGGEEVSQLTPQQLRALNALADQRVGDLLKMRAADIAAGDETLAHVVQSIHEVEGKAAAPGVRYTCTGGFIDPIGSAPYDGEQKAAIRALLASDAARREAQALLGCSK